ncbi:hypothetical protein FRUB_05447 [Fimbriiglobus ruber]|uniref:Uncharacterized protein n=1 Tax=Fimbriiglobus ruber TaxID=1908690 RepID=A0A225DPK8_9BACT|nr:hypothetical protein FRUB_05447 [Fimbriiglobus ruber]
MGELDDALRKIIRSQLRYHQERITKAIYPISAMTAYQFR